MLGPEQTPRQRIREILAEKVLSARELAQLVGIPERQVEDPQNRWPGSDEAIFDDSI
jgi:hypothetical protein